MSSKKLRLRFLVLSLQIVVVLGAVFVSGCKWQPGKNLSVGEDNPKTPPLRVSLGRFQCLTEIDKKVKAYLDSKLNEDEINAFVGCTQGALRQFEFLTRDSEGGAFKPQSLADFLNKEYLKKTQLSPGFLKEIMELKVVILGGQTTLITRQELRAISDLISVLGEIAITNLPYLKIYQRPSDLDSEDISLAQLESAQKQLRSTGEVIAKILSQKNKNYSVTAFERFLRHARLFLRWEELHQEALPVHKLMGLLLSTKEVIEGKDSDVFASDKWATFFDVYATVYGFYLNYHFKIKDRTLNYGASLESFVRDARESFKLIEKVITKNESEMLTFDSIDKLLASLKDLGFLPSNIDLKNLLPVYKRLVAYGLRNPVAVGVPKDIKGLGLRELGELKTEFNLWAKIQLYLSQSSSRGLGLTFDKQLGADDVPLHVLTQFDFSRSMTAFGFEDISVQNEIAYLKNNFAPLFKDTDQRIYIMPRDEYAAAGLKYDIASLSRLNLNRTIVRLFIRTFANDFQKLKFSGVNESEVAQFYELIRGIGFDLKVSDPRKKTGNSYFIEGNIFTFSGDGLPPMNALDKNLLDFKELAELISILWSGGVVRNNVYTNIQQDCRSKKIADGPLDLFGLHKIERSCFVNYFAGRKFSEFSNMPHMTKALSTLASSPGDRYQRALIDLQRIALIPCENQRFIERAEIATISTVLHYIEILFSTYDRNKNGYLEALEIMNAYHRFNNYLEKNIKAKYDIPFVDLDVAEFKTIFISLVQNQKLPGASNIVDLISDWRIFNDDPNEFRFAYSGHENLPQFRIDRFHVLRILRALFEATNSNYDQSACRR